MTLTEETLSGYRDVNVASVVDALWERGLAAHLPQEIKPIFPAKIVGPAVTVLLKPSTERLLPTHALELIDSSAPGSVVVIAIEGEKSVALWGGLMTAGAVANKLAGAVLDGGVRDVEEITRDFNFPVFARSINPASTVGRYVTVSSNDPIRIGDVTIKPQDLIVGDRDGVVAVPDDRIRETLEEAQEIESREREQTRLIRETGSLLKGIDKYKRI